MYFVSSNPHSLVNLVSGYARGARGARSSTGSSASGPEDLRAELAAFRDGRTEGSWENFLYFSARDYFEAQRDASAEHERRQREERAVGVTHISSRTALRVSAQVIALDRLDPAGLDPRLGDVDAERLARCPAVIVNIEYPLGLAAYNILREIAEDARHAARRLHPRQGGDAERRRRRRDDLERHPRRALGLDVLARQRVLGRRHRAVPRVRLGPRQPARGHGQDRRSSRTASTSTSTTARRSRSSRWRPGRSATRSTRSPTSIATRSARRSTSPSSRSTSGSSTTPLTRRTRRPARSGRAGSRYYGMDSTYASSVAILRRILTPGGRAGAPERAPAVATVLDHDVVAGAASSVSTPAPPSRTSSPASPNSESGPALSAAPSAARSVGDLDRRRPSGRLLPARTPFIEAEAGALTSRRYGRLGALVDPAVVFGIGEIATIGFFLAPFAGGRHWPRWCPWPAAARRRAGWRSWWPRSRCCWRCGRWRAGCGACPRTCARAPPRWWASRRWSRAHRQRRGRRLRAHRRRGVDRAGVRRDEVIEAGQRVQVVEIRGATALVAELGG